MTGSNKYAEDNLNENPQLRAEAQGYFQRLAAERDADGPANLLNLLMNYQVDKAFARTALMTTEKAEMAQRQDVKRDSLTEWVLYILETEPTDESGRWGAASKAQNTYDGYASWVSANKTNHPSRSWTAVDITTFKKSLTNTDDATKPIYGFSATRKREGAFYQWPSRLELNQLMHERFPHIVEREYDPSLETGF